MHQKCRAEAQILILVTQDSKTVQGQLIYSLILWVPWALLPKEAKPLNLQQPPTSRQTCGQRVPAAQMRLQAVSADDLHPLPNLNPLQHDIGLRMVGCIHDVLYKVPEVNCVLTSVAKWPPMPTQKPPTQCPHIHCINSQYDLWPFSRAKCLTSPLL